MINAREFVARIEPQFSRLFSFHMSSDLLFKVTDAKPVSFAEAAAVIGTTGETYYTKLSSLDYALFYSVDRSVLTFLSKKLSHFGKEATSGERPSDLSFIERYFMYQFQSLIRKLFKADSISLEPERTLSDFRQLNVFIDSDSVWFLEVQAFSEGVSLGKVYMCCPSSMFEGVQ